MFAQAFNPMNLTQTAGDAAVLTGKTGNGSSSASGQFKSIMDSLMGRVETKGSLSMDSLMDMMNIDGLTDKKGKALLALLADNIKQENPLSAFLAVDDKGLAALKTLLAGLGFDKENISRFMETLSSGDGKKQVSLNQLFSKLGEFLKENESEDDLDISSLPYLQSLLDGFGLKPVTVENILAKATQSGQGVDLDTLVSELRQLSESKATHFQGASAGQDALLKGLGLTGKAAGVLSLDEFAQKLEALIQEKNPAQATSEAMALSAKTISDSIRQGKPSSMGGVDVSLLSPVSGKDKSPGFQFDNASLKSPQPNAMDKPETAFFSGSKNAQAKPAFSEAIKEVAASLEKNTTKSLPTSKESTETPVFSSKTMSASDIYGKMAEAKAASSAEKTLPSYVSEQVTRQISRAVKMGASEMTFQIKPPDLGRVQLSIETTHEGMKIRIVTEQHASRDMLLSQVQDMKAVLADQGIKLDKIDVDVSGNFGQSMAQARQEAGQSGKERKSKDTEAFNLGKITPNEESEEPVLRRFKYARGNLDLVA